MLAVSDYNGCVVISHMQMSCSSNWHLLSSWERVQFSTEDPLPACGNYQQISLWHMYVFLRSILFYFPPHGFSSTKPYLNDILFFLSTFFWCPQLQSKLFLTCVLTALLWTCPTHLKQLSLIFYCYVHKIFITIYNKS